MTLFSLLIFILALLFSTTSSFSVSTYYSGYKYGYIDESGKVVIDIQYDRATEFEEVFVINYKHIFAAAKKNGKWGIRNQLD